MMEDAFVIEGGKRLKGHIALSGAKNIALKVIIASLLFEEKVTLTNVPRINDVLELLELVSHLGATYSFEKGTLIIDPSKMTQNVVDLLHASKIRVSFMLFAPLIYRFKECFVPNPGGCRIGARPIDRIVEGMQKLGVEVDYNSETGYYKAHVNDAPTGGTYHFQKPSHTGTELLVLLSLFAKSKTTIENAALEPEIDQLMLFLTESGAKVSRVGNSIVIDPVSKLHQTKPFKIVCDRNEAVTFASLAIATKGDIVVTGISKKPLHAFLEKLHAAGGGIEYLDETSIRYFYKGPLHATTIETAPHPGFMTDWQPNWAILMTQAEGTSMINERVFENRFSYVEELRKLGVEIDYVKAPVHNPGEYFFFNFDPSKKYNQAIRLNGPQPLHGGVLTIADLRAGATLVIAALVADGESVVNGASIVERGYENFVEKIKSLGGIITKYE